jgi:hypothetical protein
MALLMPHRISFIGRFEPGWRAAVVIGLVRMCVAAAVLS